MDDASRFREGAPLVTRGDFERAAEARAELLGGTTTTTPLAHRSAALSPEERRVWSAALTLVASELATTPRPAALAPLVPASSTVPANSDADGNPDPEGVTMLDGDAWRASCRGSRRARCGRCWLCEWEQQTDRLARPQREDPRRTAKSVDEWFEAWCAYVEDPAGAKSSLGIQLERGRDGLSYGGSFVAREPSAIRAATLFVGVAASLTEAATHARGDNQAMSVESVLDGLRALIVGLPTRTKKRGITRTPALVDDVAARWSEASEREGGARVTPRAAKELVSRWRRLAAVELAARGLIRVRRGDEDAVEVVRSRLMAGRVVGGVEGESGKAKAR